MERHFKKMSRHFFVPDLSFRPKGENLKGHSDYSFFIFNEMEYKKHSKIKVAFLCSLLVEIKGIYTLNLPHKSNHIH